MFFFNRKPQLTYPTRIAAAILLFFPAAILAAEEGAKKVSPVLSKAAASPVNVTSVAQMIIGLIFIICLIFVMGWLAKRMGMSRHAGVNKVRTLASMSVGTREKVVLIDVAGEQFLLGVAPGRVNSLHHFEEPVILDTKEVQQTPVTGLSPFASRLHEIMTKGKQS